MLYHMYTPIPIYIYIYTYIHHMQSHQIRITTPHHIRITTPQAVLSLPLHITSFWTGPTPESPPVCVPPRLSGTRRTGLCGIKLDFIIDNNYYYYIYHYYYYYYYIYPHHIRITTPQAVFSLPLEAFGSGERRIGGFAASSALAE